jgi:hypothetical protein
LPAWLRFGMDGQVMSGLSVDLGGKAEDQQDVGHVGCVLVCPSLHQFDLVWGTLPRFALLCGHMSDLP